MFNSRNLPVAIAFSIVFLIIVMVIVIIFILKSRSKFFRKEIEFQKKILSKTLETQETERKRISQDLHDDISSKLIALSLNLYLLKSKKTLEEDKIKIIETIENINKNAIETSRKISHHLFPPLLEKFGVNEALEEIVHEFNSSNQIKIIFENQTNLNVFEKLNQLHIFRITQELINNSIKHGKSTEIDIKFHQNNTKIFYDYSDNGIGIDKLKFDKNKGLGFINIESRIKSIDGSYQIDFTTNKGFSIKFTF